MSRSNSYKALLEKGGRGGHQDINLREKRTSGVLLLLSGSCKRVFMQQEPFANKLCVCGLVSICGLLGRFRRNSRLRFSHLNWTQMMSVLTALTLSKCGRRTHDLEWKGSPVCCCINTSRQFTVYQACFTKVCAECKPALCLKTLLLIGNDREIQTRDMNLRGTRFRSKIAALLVEKRKCVSLMGQLQDVQQRSQEELWLRGRGRSRPMLPQRANPVGR